MSDKKGLVEEAPTPDPVTREDLELIEARLRILVSQNDKILEYTSAIYEGLSALVAEEQVEEPPEIPNVTQANIAEVLERLGGDAPKDPRQPGFGWEAHKERGGK